MKIKIHKAPTIAFFATLLSLGALSCETPKASESREDAVMSDASPPTTICKAEDIPFLVSLTKEALTTNLPNDLYAAIPGSPHLSLETFFIVPDISRPADTLALSSATLGRYYDMDAITWGLDWIPVTNSDYAQLESNPPTEGWAVIFYVDADTGRLWSYGWGSELLLVDQNDHPLSDLAQLVHADPEVQIDAIDFNAWFLTSHPELLKCFDPPVGATKRLELMFSTTNDSPFAPNQGATLWVIEVEPQVTGPDPWKWSEFPRAIPVTGSGSLYLGPTSLPEIDALAYDRHNKLLVYSLDEPTGTPPFYAAPVEEIREFDRLIGLIVLEDAKELRSPGGQPMSTVLGGKRPTAACGIDPQYFKYRRQVTKPVTHT